MVSEVPIGEEILTRKAVRERCKRYPGGLYFFNKAVLGFNRLQPHLHLQWCNYLQMHPPQFFPPEMLSLGNDTGHSLSYRKTGWMPREHFKSVNGSVGLPLWLLSCVDVNLTIALISAHSDNTKKWLRQIAQIIEYNGFFRWAFPEIRPGKKWDQEEIIIQRDQDLSGDAQASITAYSIKSGLASQHHHYIILDDPVNEQIAGSDVEMARAVELYQHLEEILRGWAESGFLFMGTPWGREDPLQESLKEELRGFRLKWGIGVEGEWEASDVIKDRPELKPVTIEEVQKREYPNRTILPEECNEIKLEHIKAQSAEKYHMQYLCKPYDIGRNGFDLNLIREFAELPDGALQCEGHKSHTHNLKDGVTVIVSDPAYTKDKSVCETSILVGNLQPCGCRFLMHEYGGHVQPKDYIDRACDMAKQFLPFLKAYCIEDEALQLALAQWLVEKKDRGQFPIGVQIHGLKSKNRAKDARISNAQPAVNNGFWHRRPSMRHVEGLNTLLHQLYQWPYSRMRDRADAFAYFEDAWTEFPVAKQYEETPEDWDMGIKRQREDMQLFLSEEDY